MRNTWSREFTKGNLRYEVGDLFYELPSTSKGNTGAGGPPVIFFSALSFSSHFDRGTNEQPIYHSLPIKIEI